MVQTVKGESLENTTTVPLNYFFPYRFVATRRAGNTTVFLRAMDAAVFSREA